MVVRACGANYKWTVCEVQTKTLHTKKTHDGDGTVPLLPAGPALPAVGLKILTLGWLPPVVSGRRI